MSGGAGGLCPPPSPTPTMVSSSGRSVAGTSPSRRSPSSTGSGVSGCGEERGVSTVRGRGVLSLCVSPKSHPPPPPHLTLTPVSSFQSQTKAGESPETTRTLVKRRLMTDGWSLWQRGSARGGGAAPTAPPTPQTLRSSPGTPQPPPYILYKPPNTLKTLYQVPSMHPRPLPGIL